LSLIDAVLQTIVASRQSPVTSTETMELDNNIEIPAEKTTILKGHDSEVFMCAWNPTTDLLAAG